MEDRLCEVEGSAMVAGRLTRNRSVARGHSIWCSLVKTPQRCKTVKAVSKMYNGSSRIKTYLPLALKGLQIHEFSSNVLVTQIGFILLQKSTTNFCIVGFWKGVFDICFLETIKRYYDAIDFRKRVLQVSLGCGLR